MSRIAAAILAAGTSSRLGTPKQLLDLGGQPVLAHTLAAVRQSSVDIILVILGYQREQIEQRVDLSGTTVLDNQDYASGQSSSVRCAVEKVPNDVDALVFILGDQPLVEPKVIDALVKAHRENHVKIAQPVYAEGRGNPILIGRELFPELDRLRGDQGARPLLHEHRDIVVTVDVSDYHRPSDVDTPDDYKALKREFSMRQEGAR